MGNLRTKTISLNLFLVGKCLIGMRTNPEANKNGALVGGAILIALNDTRFSLVLLLRASGSGVIEFSTASGDRLSKGVSGSGR
jgi:hypothetical protein